MTEGPSLIEYVGTKKGALAMRPPPGRVTSLKFNPHPDYDGRRVEEFPTAKDAAQFMSQFNRGGVERFVSPPDLIHRATVKAIAAAVQRSDAFQSLQKQIGDLTARLTPEMLGDASTPSSKRELRVTPASSIRPLKSKPKAKAKAKAKAKG